MADKIAASIAFVVILVYLGSYAFLLHAIPLWIIIVGVLVLAAVEYFESMKAAQTDENGAE
jgi:Flp pilus assembly protein protease CpaA